ncbi:MAG TPA: T9SS type A sorting domain-containing protein [Bacteroidales bacterium]|nr:T9SS type A sorting domain-containing protein [Bacteroidales bacterium]
MRKIFSLTVILFCFTGIPAQNNLQFLGANTGAACQSIKYYNDYVFTGTGSTLRSYYVGSGSLIPYAYGFEYRYRSEIIRMKIHGHFLYVCANYDGMTKWDIADPAHPLRIFDILPDSAGMATQAVAFKGDTIYLAQYNKMCAYKDHGNTFTKIANFAVPQFGSTVVGVDVKNNLCAVSRQHWGSQNGVSFYDANTFAFISFYQQGTFLSENVIFGKNNNLLHVMSGTSINQIAPNGLFYTLDVSNPASPQKIFSDTVDGLYLAAIALPFNAENINDTIYVSNWGAIKPNGPLDTCYIRAYDATNPAHVHLINYLPGGLWNFDMTLNGKKMYVASEWYGILSVDLHDFQHPQVSGKTTTGGWNCDADVYGNKMAVANEGFGYKLYDISDPAFPVLIRQNEDPGFCVHIKFSSDGEYIYTGNISYQGFRVYRADSLIQTGYIQQAVCDGRFIVVNHRIFSELNNSLVIIDVSNPYMPSVDTIIGMNINDMAVAGEKLYISNNDSISVFDVSGNNFQQIASVMLAGNQDAQMMAVSGNNCFVFVSNKGLVKYSLDYNNPVYELNELTTTALTNGAPTFMAADTFGLYCAYRLHGLYAYDRASLAPTGWYRGGLDYRRLPNQYGVQNLFCKNNFIFLVEYFCQTSILTNDDTYSDLSASVDPDDAMTVFPNPAADQLCILIKKDLVDEKLKIQLYNINGKLVRSFVTKNNEKINCNISEMPDGVYFISLSGKQKQCQRFIKE